MTAKIFHYIEEYIEFIAGYRDVNGRQYSLFDNVPSPISLARYDVNIVDSLANQTLQLSKAYTDKQAALAIRIVDKYRKQLSNLTTPVAVPEALDKFKLGIRVVDRSKSISLCENKIVVRFPYDTKLIDLVKSSRRESQGAVEFDNDDKVWRLALTEYAVNWAVTVGRANDFTISDDIVDLYDRIVEEEQKNYRIQLIKTDTGFTITNAAASLIDYVNNNLGGLGADNLVALLDNAGVLGYEVDPALYSLLPAEFTELSAVLMSTRSHRFEKNTVELEAIVAYARQVNRLPVYVYDSGLPKKSSEDIVYLNNSRTAAVDIKPKLLVTTTSLMLGSKKQAWQVNAEKIIVIE
jgi:hypothetical protein